MKSISFRVLVIIVCFGFSHYAIASIESECNIYDISDFEWDDTYDPFYYFPKANTIEGIDEKFHYCLSAYKKKWSSNHFKVIRFVEKYEKYRKNRNKIIDHIKIRETKNKGDIKYKELESKLEKLMSEVEVTFNHGYFNDYKSAYLENSNVSFNKSAKPFSSSRKDQLVKVASELNVLVLLYKSTIENNNLDAKRFLDGMHAVDLYIILPSALKTFLDKGIFEPYLTEFLKVSINVKKEIAVKLQAKTENAEQLLFFATKDEIKAFENYKWKFDKLKFIRQSLINKGIASSLLVKLDGTVSQLDISLKKYEDIMIKAKKVELKKKKEREAAVKRKEDNSKKYISNSVESNLANHLNSLGYSDAVLTFGRFGNYVGSTYAGIMCIGTLYKGSSYKLKENENNFVLTFGNNSLLNFEPEVSLDLSLMRANALQYQINDIIIHKERAKNTDIGKLQLLIDLISTCEKKNDIWLMDVTWGKPLLTYSRTL